MGKYLDAEFLWNLGMIKTRSCLLCDTFLWVLSHLNLSDYYNMSGHTK